MRLITRRVILIPISGRGFVGDELSKSLEPVVLIPSMLFEPSVL